MDSSGGVSPDPLREQKNVPSDEVDHAQGMVLDREEPIGVHPREEVRSMWKTISIITALVVVSAVFAPTVSAQQYPNVGNVKAFSAGANFMSLPGYLRYLVYQQTGQWLTRTEAARVIQQQTGQ
jgi:hypothetical protein